MVWKGQNTKNQSLITDFTKGGMRLGTREPRDLLSTPNHLSYRQVRADAQVHGASKVISSNRTLIRPISTAIALGSEGSSDLWKSPYRTHDKNVLPVEHLKYLWTL